MLKLAVRLQQLKFHAQDRGATAVEYGLMVALIAAVIVAVVTTLGSNLESLFSWIGGKITHP